MKNQIKRIIAVAILIIVLAIGGHYAYEQYNTNPRIEASNKIIEAKGIKLNDTDKGIVDEILKNDTDLEYAYITHSGNTVMLTVKFNKGIQDKAKYSKINKYMAEVRAQYKGKNINVKTMP